MNGKRGLVESTLVKFVIALLILAVVGAIIFQKFGFFGAQYNKLEIQANARSCQSQGQFGVGTVIYDIDFGVDAKGDGFPDGCDFCLGGDDGVVDKDGDGIPPACDDDSDNPPPRDANIAKICANAKPVDGRCRPGKWLDKTKQCQLKCYGQPHQRI